MLMPGRKYSSDKYRYGFNGKENDNEVKGEGNQQDYGMRVYDLRLGKFLSVDPLASKYPFYTPYQFSGNMPIKFIDLDGAEPAEKGEYKNQVKTGTQKGTDIAKSWIWTGDTWIENELKTVTVYSPTYRQPIAQAVKDYYDNTKSKADVQIARDLAEKLFDNSEIGKKLKSLLPSEPDLEETAKEIVKRIRGEENNNLYNSVKILHTIKAQPVDGAISGIQLS